MNLYQLLKDIKEYPKEIYFKDSPKEEFRQQRIGYNQATSVFKLFLEGIELYDIGKTNTEKLWGLKFKRSHP